MVYSHQLAADQPGRRAIGDAQRQIDPIVDQIHVAIFQPQPHVHLRVAAQELRHVRMQHEAAHRLGHADADQPLGSTAPRPPIAMTASAAASRVRQCANASSPLSLSRSLRVVRCSSCSASACSSFATLRLTAEGEVPSLRAAAEKLPLYHLNENGHFGQQGVRKICAHDAKVHCDGGGLSLDYDMNIMALRTEEKNDDRTTLLLQ